ncbi:diacylglycerol kinase family protein [Compostibacter hankyongensis]|uniref:Diacylglycerol kinase family protein n=1 Tax=Compostibacter hankyongensis TaxID=1007089 RepID=A0ABP8FEC1_9BACT
MESKEKFSLRSRLCSFRYAFSGLLRFFRTEHNAWIHLLAAVLVVLAGLVFRLTKGEWTGIAFSIGLVLCAEVFNTCIEKMMDLLSPVRDERVKYIKDLAAGAVLVAAATAAVIGLLIFIPRLI